MPEIVTIFEPRDVTITRHPETVTLEITNKDGSSEVLIISAEKALTAPGLLFVGDPDQANKGLGYEAYNR